MGVEIPLMELKNTEVSIHVFKILLIGIPSIRLQTTESQCHVV